MQIVGASWSVLYRDGSYLHQYDAEHPLAQSGEVPYRAIQWDHVDSLFFESQYVKREFQVQRNEGYAIGLRSRHFATPDGAGTMCFMVLTYPEGGTHQDAVHVLYWFPDDSMHSCYLFECPDVARYGVGAANGRQEGLMPEHGAVRLTVDAECEPVT